MKNFVLGAIVCAMMSQSVKASQAPHARPLQLGVKEQLSTNAQFSADGRLFAAMSYRFTTYAKTFRVWNAQTAAPVASWRLRTLQHFALSPDGRTVAVITGQGQRRGIGIPFAVELRDTHSGKVKRTIIRAGSINAAVHSLAWSRDGRLLATGSGDALARVWDVRTGRRLASLRAEGYMGAIQFSHDGKLLATVGDRFQGRGRVKLWNWRQKKQLGVASFRTYSIYATLTFSPDRKRLVVGDRSDGRTSLFDTKTLQSVQQLPAPSEVGPNRGVPAPRVAFSRDGKLMAFVGGSEIVVQNVTSARTVLRHKLQRSTGPHVLALQFLPTGQLCWVAVRYEYEEDGTIGSHGLVVPRVCSIRL